MNAQLRDQSAEMLLALDLLDFVTAKFTYPYLHTSEHAIQHIRGIGDRALGLIGWTVIDLPGREVPVNVVVPSVPGWLVRPDLAEEMLAQVDGLANTAAAAVREGTVEGLAVNDDFGLTTAEGVLVRTWSVIGVGTEHG